MYWCFQELLNWRIMVTSSLPMRADDPSTLMADRFCRATSGSSTTTQWWRYVDMIEIYSGHDIFDGYRVKRGSNWLNLSLQIAGLRFVFLINLELISLIKAEAAKMTQQWTSAIQQENPHEGRTGRIWIQSVPLCRTVVNRCSFLAQ